MSDDIISRSALLKELVFDYAYAAADIVKAAPAVDAVPVVHGRWGRNLCSRCGTHKPYDYDGRFVSTNYCPNCGADMRERAVEGAGPYKEQNEMDRRRAWIKLQRRCPMRLILEDVKTGERSDLCYAEHDGVETHAPNRFCDMESCPGLEEFMEAVIMGVEE